jgi:hypothetical protein
MAIDFSKGLNMTDRDMLAVRPYESKCDIFGRDYRPKIIESKAEIGRILTLTVILTDRELLG